MYATTMSDRAQLYELFNSQLDAIFITYYKEAAVKEDVVSN